MPRSSELDNDGDSIDNFYRTNHWRFEYEGEVVTASIGLEVSDVDAPRFLS